MLEIGITFTKPKIITICTSYKYISEILDCYRKLTDKGYIVLLPAFNCVSKTKDYYMNLHKKKILASDAIYVVNKDGYIGESVMEEIVFAQFNCKDVLYLEDV